VSEIERNICYLRIAELYRILNRMSDVRGVMNCTKGCLSLPSTSVAVLCVVGSIIITIFLGGINPLFASSSSQMPGIMGNNMGMQNMTTMMGQHMGIQNMTQ
jgi:hypothetical protein